jgi:hypothetical protein
MLTSLTVQNIELLTPSYTKPDAKDDSTSVETKLESVIRQSAQTEGEPSLPLPGQDSRRPSLDSFHSAISSSLGSACSIISLSGTLVNNTCEAFCSCQCHVTSQIRTPQWIRQILGSMSFHGNTSVLLSRRPCNKSCRWSGPSSVQFTYFAPSWTLLRTFNIYVKFQCLRGLDFNIRLPRVIPYNTMGWSMIELGRLATLKEIVDRGATFPFDVNSSGKSLTECRTHSRYKPSS